MNEKHKYFAHIVFLDFFQVFLIVSNMCSAQPDLLDIQDKQNYSMIL